MAEQKSEIAEEAKAKRKLIDEYEEKAKAMRVVNSEMEWKSSLLTASLQKVSSARGSCWRVALRFSTFTKQSNNRAIFRSRDRACMQLSARAIENSSNQDFQRLDRHNNIITNARKHVPSSIELVCGVWYMLCSAHVFNGLSRVLCALACS